MKAIRILIVEDEPKLQDSLQRTYRSKFSELGYDSVTIESALTFDDARALAKGAESNPYDLVSLDVNLGDKISTGLDLLGTFNRFRSAWMISLFTGVETDASLDETIGEKHADDIRQTLRKDAYSRFPAERLLVMEKPSPSLDSREAEKLFTNRVNQIALIYNELGRLRYIFRPLSVPGVKRVPGKKPAQFIGTRSQQWQVRFDCGDIRTLPDKAGFKTLHHLLSLDRDKSLTPEAASALEPTKNVKKEAEEALSKQEQHASQEDRIAAYFLQHGIDNWKELSAEEQDRVVNAALSLDIRKYVELRELEVEDDLAPMEEDELTAIKDKLGPLCDLAETAFQRLHPEASATGYSDGSDSESPISISQSGQEGLHGAGGNYTREKGRKGSDSADAQKFRKRMERVRDCLRENGFPEFGDHIYTWIQSTGANWSYNPPSEIEWTTG